MHSLYKSNSLSPQHTSCSISDLCEFGVFPPPSTSSLNFLPIHIHILLPHRFHQVSPIIPFIIHSAIKSNICLSGKALTGTENKTTKAQSFQGHFKKEGKRLNNSCKSKHRLMNCMMYRRQWQCEGCSDQTSI